MNFFQHGIGDYAAATAHLTWLEDMAYTRLIRAYYEREAPLPLEQKALFKLARATTKEQKAAVRTVIHEFFNEEKDGFHNARCDEEIAKYQISQEESEQRKAHERERQARYRDERKRLFAELKMLDIVPTFDTSNSELKTLLRNASVTRDTEKPVTRTATAIQNPYPHPHPIQDKAPLQQDGHPRLGQNGSGTLCPDDFQPDQKTLNWFIQKMMPAPTEEEIFGFVNFFISIGLLRHDWQATFRHNLPEYRKKVRAASSRGTTTPGHAKSASRMWAESIDSDAKDQQP